MCSFDRTKTRGGTDLQHRAPHLHGRRIAVVGSQIFSYTHTDAIARYQRMTGFVFYPMGWDDNGLPTERRVENYFGVRCRPTLRRRYDPEKLRSRSGKDRGPSADQLRGDYCEQRSHRREGVRGQSWLSGPSVDWERTLHDHRRTPVAGPNAFLRTRRGEVIPERGTACGTTFPTAGTQARLEDRDRPGAYHAVAFWPVDETGIRTDRHRPPGPNCRQLCGPRRPPRRRPLPAAVRSDRPHPVFGSRSRSWPTLGRTRQGNRHRRGSVRSATPPMSPGGANRPADPRGHGTGRALEVEAPGLDHHRTRPAPRTSDRRGDHGGPRSRWPSSCASPATSSGEPEKIQHPGEVLSRRRQAPRRSSPRGSGTSATAAVRRDEDPCGRRVTPSAGTRLACATAGTVQRGSRLNGDWLISAAAVLRVPIPVWYAVGRRGQPIYTDRSSRRGAACRSILRPTRPPSDAPGPARGARRFRGDPDIMDTWATQFAHRSPVAGRTTPTCSPGVPHGSCARRPPHHPDLAVLTTCAPLRGRRPRRGPTRPVGLDPGSRPQEDVEVQGNV